MIMFALTVGFISIVALKQPYLPHLHVEPELVCGFGFPHLFFPPTFKTKFLTSSLLRYVQAYLFKNKMSSIKVCINH